MFRLGADTKSFDIMVQSGVNAERWFLAYPTDKIIQKGETVLIDIGIRYNDYSSDMARGVGYGALSDEQERAAGYLSGGVETGSGGAQTRNDR